MKHALGLGIIILFAFIGEIIKSILPFPIPASIYGMILLFLALKFKVIKLEQINKIAHYLIGIMLIFFIMPAVSIMDSFNLIKDNLIQILIAIIIPTILVVIVTGLVTQKVETVYKKRKGSQNGSIS